MAMTPKPTSGPDKIPACPSSSHVRNSESRGSSVTPLSSQGRAQRSDNFFLLTIVPHLPHSVFAYVEAVPYTFTQGTTQARMRATPSWNWGRYRDIKHRQARRTDSKAEGPGGTISGLFALLGIVVNVLHF